MGASVQTSSLLEHFLCAHYIARHCARQFPVVQSLSCVQLFAAPWTAARQACLSSTIFQSLLTFIFIESMTSSSHLILCCPLLLLSVFPRIRVFSNESALRTRWPKYWRFSFSISASKDYSGLTSFRIDWFDLLAEIPSAGHCGGSYIKRMGLRVEAGRDGQQTRTQEPEQRDVQQRCTRYGHPLEKRHRDCLLRRSRFWLKPRKVGGSCRGGRFAEEVPEQRFGGRGGLGMSGEAWVPAGENWAVSLLPSVHHAFPSRGSCPRVGPAMEAGTR